MVANMTHFVGIFTTSSCFSTLSNLLDTWVVDTDTTVHMTPFYTLLYDVNLLSNPISIRMPDGHVLTIDRVGYVKSSPSLVINSMFFIPQFTHNLISIQELVVDQSLIATFDDSKCVFHDLSSSMLAAIVEVSNGLYEHETGASHSCSSI